MNEKTMEFLGALKRLKNDKDTDWDSILQGSTFQGTAEWQEFKTRPGYWDVGSMTLILQLASIFRYADPEAIEPLHRVMDRIVEAGCQDNS